MELARPGGWYPDPGDRRMLRYWDGEAWTSQVGPAPAPGWYRDPADGRGLRYWGGGAWTTSVTAAPTPANPFAASGPSAPAAATAVITPPGAAAPTPVAAPPAPTAALVESPAPPVEPPPAVAAREAAARLHATPPATAPELPKSGGARAEEEPAARVEPKRRRGTVIVALVAALLLALAVGGYFVMKKWGSGPAGVLGSSSAPSVQAPPGYHLVSLGSAGISFAVRDSWLALDPTSTALKQAEQRVAAANPQLASTLTDFGTAASNIRFLAIDVGNRVYGSNVEVLSLKLAKSALSDPVDAGVAFRKQIPNAVASPTTVAGTRGLLVTGTVDLTLPSGGQLAVHATGYVVGTPAGVYSIMFGTTDDGSQDAEVHTAVRTLRLTA
jgi:hypothetical protein